MRGAAALAVALAARLAAGFTQPEANFLLDINGISVGVEPDHVCVIEEKLGEEVGGKASCFGFEDESGRMDPPADGLFVQVVTGRQYGCGINLDQSVSCWGLMAAPQGLFTQLTGEDFFVCGVMVDNSVRCSGNVPFAEDQVPTGKKLVQVSCGGGHCCALDDQALPHCWGPSDARACVFITPPAEAGQAGSKSIGASAGASGGASGEEDEDEDEDEDAYEDEEDDSTGAGAAKARVQMRQIAASNEWSCGISLEGQNLHCWGHKRAHKKKPEQHPPKLLAGPWKQVAAGALGVCALRESKDNGGSPADSLQCWGMVNFFLPQALRSGKYDQVAVGSLLSCAVTMESELACWGPSQGNIDELDIPDTLVIA